MLHCFKHSPVLPLNKTKCVPYQNFTTHVDTYNLTMLHCFKHSPVLPLNNTVNAGSHQMCALSKFLQHM